MHDKQDLTDVTNQCVIRDARSMQYQLSPIWFLVHGDTTTTAMAASIASFYAGVQLGHVEAGLRSYDITTPFPEEYNRRVTSLIARLHFAPTNRSRDQLLAEQVPGFEYCCDG